TLQSLENGLHNTARNPGSVEKRDPFSSISLNHFLSDCRDDSLAARKTTSICRKRIIIDKIGQLESTSTCFPLRIISDSNNHRTISSMKELIRNKIGMLISPAPGFTASNESILRNIDQRCRRARRQ